MTSAVNKPIEVFLSYSHADEGLKTELLKQLGPLRWDSHIKVWHDKLVEPGSPWALDIDSHIRTASLVLLLVSADFLSSEYCYSIEMKQALQRHDSGSAVVVPIILRSCDWQASPLGKLQALPADGRPIVNWPDKDQALASVAQAIRARVEHMTGGVEQVVCSPEVLIPGRSLRIGEIQFLFIPPGIFPMGSEGHYAHEHPVHPVSVSAFFLGTTLVTNRQFTRFVDQTGYVTDAEITGVGMCLADNRPVAMKKADWRRPSGPRSSVVDKNDHPVVQINWRDATAYTEWMSRVTGLHVSLPTEAQWEYAAAGSEGRIWPFGNTYEARKANLEGSGTSPIGGYEAHARGAYDLAGNVYEWCQDWFAIGWRDGGHRLDGGVTVDPPGPRGGTDRVLKGGSWLDGAEHSRCANRMAGRPDISAANWGMRCCLHIDEKLRGALLSKADWGMTETEYGLYPGGGDCGVRT